MKILGCLEFSGIIIVCVEHCAWVMDDMKQISIIANIKSERQKYELKYGGWSRMRWWSNSNHNNQTVV